MLLYFMVLVAIIAQEPGGCGPNNMNGSQVECKVTFTHNAEVGYAITITIKNIGHGDLVFFEDQLPWRDPVATTLIAIPLDPSGPPAMPILKLIDPTVRRVTLKPGKLLEGEIILKERFSGWNQVVANKEVSIFWSFVVQDANATRHGRYSGYFLIGPSLGPV